MAKDFSYEITERIALLSEDDKGYRKELNYISYNGFKPKYDIRSWSPDGKMGKGITLNDKEAETLAAAIADRYIKNHPEAFKKPEWRPEPIQQELPKQDEGADIVPFRARRNDPQPLAPVAEKPKTETPKKVKQSAPARKQSKINVPADIKLPF